MATAECYCIFLDPAGIISGIFNFVPINRFIVLYNLGNTYDNNVFLFFFQICGSPLSLGLQPGNERQVCPETEDGEVPDARVLSITTLQHHEILRGRVLLWYVYCVL